jgi:hypothetical protein
MPQGFIESTNIGISSINSLKDIHTSTAWNQADSSINGLRNWFRDNIGNKGDFHNNRKSGEYAAFSDFSNTAIYGFYVHAWNESTSKYADANNGGVTLWAYRGNGNVGNFKFWLESRGWAVPNGDNGTGTNTAFHKLNSGTYTVHVEHLNLPRQTFYITIHYGGSSSTMTYYYTNSAGTTVEVNHSLGGDTRLFIIDDNKRFKLIS